jgi:hypothetical protein
MAQTLFSLVAVMAIISELGSNGVLPAPLPGV